MDYIVKPGALIKGADGRLLAAGTMLDLGEEDALRLSHCVELAPPKAADNADAKPEAKPTK